MAYVSKYMAKVSSPEDDRAAVDSDGHSDREFINVAYFAGSGETNQESIPVLVASI